MPTTPALTPKPAACPLPEKPEIYEVVLEDGFSSFLFFTPAGKEWRTGPRPDSKPVGTGHQITICPKGPRQITACFAS